MNIAIIFAGGVGQRMHTGGIPKQFLKLHGKPIIVYTLEHFQKSLCIDAIIISLIEPWIPYCNEIVREYGLDKVVAIIPGGKTGFYSINYALEKAAELYPADSIVLIHDGVRPLIDSDLISRNIEAVKKYGSGVTASKAIETIVQAESDSIQKIINRDQCLIAKAPQSFFLRDILMFHRRAISENKDNFIDSACLMNHYGFPLYVVEGSADNIKITTPTDFFVFKAFLEAKENLEIFGV